MRLLLPLTIPSSQPQRLAPFPLLSRFYIILFVLTTHTSILCVLSVQLFDAMAIEEVYQTLKPAALYEEALSLVREGKVTYRSLR